ncbi:response regulator transcription factor [Methanococcoides sp. SA1]|nr:response regulator transcription factor [Methanococcoides sp. SA1]
MSEKQGTILVVDDQPANLKVLLAFLKKHNFHTLVADTGERAIKALLNDVKPDLILLDVMMPGINGFETCKQIKANPDIAAIPIVFMTAYDSVEDKLTGFAAGGVDYITKPFEHVEVLARINAHIQLRQKELKLQVIVDERTADLQKSNYKLEQNNNALKLILEQQLEAREEVEETMAAGLKKRVYPYLDLLAEGLSPDKKEYISVIRNNLDALAVPLTGKLTNTFWNLSAKETLVADLVKQGKSTREISHLLNISPATTEKYRNKIRKKIGIVGNKVRLITYLNQI